MGNCGRYTLVKSKKKDNDIYMRVLFSEKYLTLRKKLLRVKDTLKLTSNFASSQQLCHTQETWSKITYKLGGFQHPPFSSDSSPTFKTKEDNYFETL